MGREDVFKLLNDIAVADGLSHGVVAALTLIVFSVMRTMLPVKGLALVFAPGIYWGGLMGIFAARYWGLVLTADKAANVVATAALGMIAALVFMMLLARLADAAVRIRNPLGSKPA